MASWSLAGLPKYLSNQDVDLVLERCKGGSAEEQRDRAILFLLARLGLRAGEIAQLTLDDIRWDTGEITIRGKGGALNRLPLLIDVGEALVAYLHHGRPKCSSRNVFIRVRAPRQGFTGGDAINRVVRVALKRAGLDPSGKGAHVLRHSLATRMLRGGASLPEIGQILGHELPKTTAIYAKVDLAALRALRGDKKLNLTEGVDPVEPKHLREHGGSLWFKGKGPERHAQDASRTAPPAGD